MQEQDFQVVKEVTQSDSRGRLTLGQVVKGKSYRVMINDEGQILLDPVVSIPKRELWLWQNSDALASVKRGIEQASTESRDLGDFSQYADWKRSYSSTDLDDRHQVYVGANGHLPLQNLSVIT